MNQVQGFFRFCCENELVQIHQEIGIRKLIGEAKEVTRTTAEYTVLQ